MEMQKTSNSQSKLEKEEWNISEEHKQKTAYEMSLCDWSSDVCSSDLEKTDAGRDWGQEKKGTTEDEMAGWHHCLDGRESE